MYYANQYLAINLRVPKVLPILDKQNLHSYPIDLFRFQDFINLVLESIQI